MLFMLTKYITGLCTIRFRILLKTDAMLLSVNPRKYVCATPQGVQALKIALCYSVSAKRNLLSSTICVSTLTIIVALQWWKRDT